MINRAVALLLILIAASITAVGCGDDDSSDGGSDTIETSSLAKAEFIKRADKICSKGSAKALEDLTVYMEDNKSPAQNEKELTAEAIQETVLPELEDQFDEIEDLGAPAGDEREIEALLAAMRSSIVDVEGRRELTLVSNIAPDFRQAGKLSRRYGIEACAYG